MKDSPCKDCPNRTPGCHSTCDGYKEFRATLNKISEKERNRKMGQTTIYPRRQTYTARMNTEADILTMKQNGELKK